MAVPTTPLELEIDATQLSIGDARLLTGRIDTNNIELVAQFGQFLIAHSKWSETDVDRITTGEMESIITQVKDKFTAATVPNSNGALSKSSDG